MKKLLVILLCLPMIGFGQCEHPTNITSGLIDSTTVIIKWDYQQNINHYKIRFRETGSSTWINTSNIPGSDSNIVIANLSVNLIYEYSIKTWCNDGSLMNWSAYKYFSTYSYDNPDCLNWDLPFIIEGKSANISHVQQNKYGTFFFGSTSNDPTNLDFNDTTILSSVPLVFFGKLGRQGNLEWVMHNVDAPSCYGWFEGLYFKLALLTDEALYFSLEITGNSLTFNNGHTISAFGNCNDGLQGSVLVKYNYHTMQIEWSLPLDVEYSNFHHIAEYNNKIYITGSCYTNQGGSSIGFGANNIDIGADMEYIGNSNDLSFVFEIPGGKW